MSAGAQAQAGHIASHHLTMGRPHRLRAWSSRPALTLVLCGTWAHTWFLGDIDQITAWPPDCRYTSVCAEVTPSALPRTPASSSLRGPTVPKHTHMHTNICIFTHTHTHVYAYIYVHTYILVYSQDLYSNTHVKLIHSHTTYPHSYMHTLMHSYTYTLSDTYI